MPRRALPTSCAAVTCFTPPCVHRLLQALLGLPRRAITITACCCDADGRKLSKSTQSTGLRELRAQGLSPRDIRRLAGLD